MQASRRSRIIVLISAILVVITVSLLIAVVADGAELVTAVGVFVVGSLALLAFKASIEVGTMATRSERSNSNTAKTMESARREAVGVACRVETISDELSASVDSIRQEVSRLDKEIPRLDLEIERVSNEILATTADRIALQEAASVERQRATDKRVKELEHRVIRTAHRIEHERRARLASRQDDDLNNTGIIDSVRVLRIIEDVEAGRVPPEHISDQFPDEVIGLSGRKFRTLVCELVRLFEHRGAYVEIGTYRGMTICTSAVANSTTRHIGVDDFSQVDDDCTNRSIFEALVTDLGLDNVDFVETDFREFLSDRTLAGIRDASVFYFDASHDYRSQLLALLHGSQQTIEGGVMLVDDCNYAHVRAATYDFCDYNPDWALIFEQYTSGHPNRADDETRVDMLAGWWDGVHVLLHDPKHSVERLERQPDALLERFFLAQHVGENCRTEDVRSRIVTRVGDGAEFSNR